MDKSRYSIDSWNEHLMLLLMASEVYKIIIKIFVYIKNYLYLCTDKFNY